MLLLLFHLAFNLARRTLMLPGWPANRLYGGMMVSGGTTESGATAQQSFRTDRRPYLETHV